MAVRDLGSLLAQADVEQNLLRLARAPVSQFGTPTQPFLGATILPEQTVAENAYREEKLTYRTVIANHGTRYSPVQIKGSAMTGYVDVTLYHSDIGATLTSRDYDSLLRFLRSNQDMEAMSSLIKFTDSQLVSPLLIRNEADRWKVLENASLTLAGDNGYTETISYSNPSGHRVSAGGAWSNNAYDPFADIYALELMLNAKGLKLARLITSRNVATILMANAKVATRTNRITISAGTILAQESRATLSTVNAALALDSLPPLELYDQLYRDQSGTHRYMSNNVMIGIAATGRDAELDLGDRMFILPNTLGYMAIGTPAGQANPGRALLVQSFRDKPPRIDGQSWQAAGVVITEPEGVVVINSIS